MREANPARAVKRTRGKRPDVRACSLCYSCRLLRQHVRIRLCKGQILGIIIHTFTDQQINILSKHTELLCRSRISNKCQ